jgi:hypothetical protein
MVTATAALVDASRGCRRRASWRKALSAAAGDPRTRSTGDADRGGGRRGLRAFLDLDADEEQIEFPTCTRTRAGWASRERASRARTHAAARPVGVHIPAPSTTTAILQAHVTNLDASPCVTVALCRAPGHDPGGQPSPGADGSSHQRAVRDRALDRVTQRRRARRLAVAGLPDVTIGETLADGTTPARCQ